MNTTTYEVHVPVEQYGFITANVEGTAEDAVLAYNEVVRASKGGEGVGIKTLASILVEYVKTGAIESGGNYDFSKNEGLLLAEVKKLLRKEQ